MQQERDYKAAIIIIGNEILSGRTVDANTSWLAERLNADYGILLDEVRIVPDVRERIVDTVKELRSKFDYVFTTGGIGPTHDDITAECIAAAFEVELEMNEEARGLLLEHYGEDDLTAARLRMARIPRGAQLIKNAVSGAPGFVIGNVFVFAGVPKIMQNMFGNLDGLIKGGEPVQSRTVACMLPESVISDGLADLQHRFPGVNIGSYPSMHNGHLGVYVVLRSTSLPAIEECKDFVEDVIRAAGGEPMIMAG